MITPGRLVLVGPYPPPWGGISVHLRALRALAERNRIDAEILDVGEAHGTRTGEGRIFDGGSRIRFLAGLAKALGRGDAVHVHTPGNNLKAWMVALAASRPGRFEDRRLLTVHSGLAPAFLGSSSRARSMARSASEGYRRILCTNDGIAGALEACGIPRAKLRVISPFLPSDDVTRRVPARARIARSRHSPLLACALAPGVQYGEQVLLDALAILADRRKRIGCVVFGPDTMSGLPGKVAALGLEGVVIPLGQIDHDEALGVIELSDVFVRPTLADGDSLSVREALGLGVRVVASDAAPRPPGAVTFAAGDASALAAAIDSSLAGGLPGKGGGGGGEASALEAWRTIGLAMQGATS
ncbi:MAG TPA: glycosyltransferase [Vulgatibacter sp.]